MRHRVFSSDAETIASVAEELTGVLLVDEAYVDFVDPGHWPRPDVPPSRPGQSAAAPNTVEGLFPCRHAGRVPARQHGSRGPHPHQDARQLQRRHPRPDCGGGRLRRPRTRRAGLACRARRTPEIDGRAREARGFVYRNPNRISYSPRCPPAWPRRHCSWGFANVASWFVTSTRHVWPTVCASPLARPRRTTCC